MRKKLLPMLLFLFTANLYPIVSISIGQACTVGMVMRYFKLRHSAYPFDWLVSPCEGVLRAFLEDFENMLCHDSLSIRSYDNYGVVDSYGFEYVHDFPTINSNTDDGRAIADDHQAGGVIDPSWRDYLPQVVEKYRRRISRLKEALSGTDKIYLIRHGDMTKSQAIRFRDLIYHKYSHLDFILVVISEQKECQESWNVERIINIYFKDNGSSATDPEKWRPIFERLNLIPF